MRSLFPSDALNMNKEAALHTDFHSSSFILDPFFHRNSFLLLLSLSLKNFRFSSSLLMWLEGSFAPHPDTFTKINLESMFEAMFKLENDLHESW